MTDKVLPRSAESRRVIAFAVAILGVILMFSSIVSLWKSDREQAKTLETYAVNVDTLKQQVRSKGDDPVVEADTPVNVSIQRAKSLPGANGSNGLAGRDGKSGKDGKDSLIPGPRGPAGKAGKNGAHGTDSDTPGPQGTPGSAGPQGEPGAPGLQGEPGAAGRDGRSIKSAKCSEETGRWVVTFSDDTQDTDAGNCRVVAAN